MIDTVALTIQQKDFKILDHKRFTPSSRGLFEKPYAEFGGSVYIKCTCNPTKKDLLRYKYLPRLTLIKAVRRGGYNISLKVEFSVPKLLYGNNFDEVEESDFGEVCWLLKEMLQYMGVEVSDIKAIASAEVAVIHYSKNIVLTDYMTPYSILKEVMKVNANTLLDLNQSDFRNEGHAIKFHTNDFELTFYDKVKDLQKAKISEKRSVEKDNYVQLTLFDKPEIKKPFEVLRVEVRLGSRKRIKDMLGKTGLAETGLQFNNLFSLKIAREVLLYLMQKLESQYPKIISTEARTNEEFLSQLMIDNPGIKYKQALALIGARVLLQESGVRGFRKITESLGKVNWYRFNKSMNQHLISGAISPFQYVVERIDKFERIELEKYREKL